MELFRHSTTADYLYRAVLRAQLTERLGIGWTPVKNGYADVAGIPRPIVEHFSRRRGEITAELERRGDDGTTAAQAATLAIRGAKAKGSDEPTLRERWAGRGEEVEYGPDQVRQILAEAALRKPAPAGRSTRRRYSARRGSPGSRRRSPAVMCSGRLAEDAARGGQPRRAATAR